MTVLFCKYKYHQGFVSIMADFTTFYSAGQCASWSGSSQSRTCTLEGYWYGCRQLSDMPFLDQWHSRTYFVAPGSVPPTDPAQKQPPIKRSKTCESFQLSEQQLALIREDTPNRKLWDEALGCLKEGPVSMLVCQVSWEGLCPLDGFPWDTWRVILRNCQGCIPTHRCSE